MRFLIIIPIIIVMLITRKLQSNRSTEQKQQITQMSKVVIILYAIGIAIFFGIIILFALTFA